MGIKSKAMCIAVVAVCLVMLSMTRSFAEPTPFEKGRAAYDKGQYKPAALHFTDVLKKSPDDLKILGLLGQCYLNLYSEKSPEYASKAVGIYKRILHLNEADGAARFNLARAYAWDGQRDEAVALYLAHLEQEPSSTAAMMELAQIYAWKPPTFEQAKTYADKILELEPENVGAHLILARVNSWENHQTKAVEHFEKVLEQEPNNDPVRLEYANALTKAGQFDLAEGQFNYLASRKNLEAGSLEGLAEAYFHARRFQEASGVVTSLLRKDPENPTALKIKGRLQAERREYDQAAQTLRMALALSGPQRNEVRLALARTLAMNRNTYDQAVEQYLRLIDENPDSTRFQEELARFDAFVGKQEKAEEEFEKLISASPENGRLRVEFVAMLIRAGRYDRAVKECEAMMTLDRDNFDVGTLLGEVYIEAGEYGKARSAYEDVLARKADYQPALVGLGWAHHMIATEHINRCLVLSRSIQEQSLGLVDRIKWLYHRLVKGWHEGRALAVLKEAVQKYPQSTGPSLRLAELYSRNGQYDLALASYQKAAAIDPNAADAYLGMGWVYGKMGDQKASLGAIGNATRIDAAGENLLKGLGEAFAFQQDLASATTDLEKSLADDYDDIGIHRKLVRLYAQNRFMQDRAIDEAMFVLRKDPSDSETRRRLAELYRDSGNHEDAARLYQTLLNEKPGDPDLTLALASEKALTSDGQRETDALAQKLESDPYDLSARLAYARILLVRDKPEQAKKQFSILLKAEPENQFALMGLAQAAQKSGDLALAASTYRQVLDKSPDIFEANLGLGRIDLQTGRYDRAVALFGTAMEEQPGSLEALSELAYGHYRYGRQRSIQGTARQKTWFAPLPASGGTVAQAAIASDKSESIQTELTDDPGNCDLRFQLAKKLQAENRSEEAAAEYKNLLQSCPDHIGARVALADIFSVSPTTYTYAIAEAERIVAQDPDNYAAHLKLAKLFNWSNKYNAAAAQYRWCLKKKPEDAALRKELAGMFTLARRYDEGITQYKTILDQDPNRHDVRQAVADLYAKAGRSDEAIEEYRTILANDPNNYEASVSLARLYGDDRHHYDQAVEMYRRLMVHFPTQTELRREFGRMMYAQGKYEDAQRALEEAAAQNPDSAELQLMLGKIYFARQDSRAARGCFERALKISKDLTEAHAYLARIFSESPATRGKAIAHGKQVLKAEPGNQEVRRVVAEALAQSADYDQAADYYQALLVENPNDKYTQIQYAQALSRSGRHAEAIDIFNRLAERYPTDLEIRLALGEAQVAKGLYQQAIGHLERTVTQQPWNVRARRALARAFKGAGDVEKAIGQYKRILIIDPEDRESKEYLAAYDIEFTEGALLEEYFDYPGKVRQASRGPELPISPYALDEVDQALLSHKMQIAEQMLYRNRVKRARYIYEDLAKKYPNDAKIRMSLAETYAASGMWHHARKEYEKVLELSPENKEAAAGLRKLDYDSSPRVIYFAGTKGASRFDNKTAVYKGGGRFVYKFWDNSELVGEVTVERYSQDDEESIDLLSPTIGVKLGLYGEVTLRGQYSYNRFSDLDPTHNYFGSVSTNLFDVAGLEGYYYHDDVRQTLQAMDQEIGRDNVGGVVELYPMGRLRIRGEYRYSQLDGSDWVDENKSAFITASAGYTFLDNPWFAVRYVYTQLKYESQQPGNSGVYWSPDNYANHAIPVELLGYAKALSYFCGLAPSYNIVSGEDDNFGISTFAGLDWEMAIAHKLGLDVSGAWGLGDADWEYKALLSYTYTFGNHSAGLKDR